MSKKLRSTDWFGKTDKMGFVHRSWLRNQGYPDDYFQGRPVIGICNTWSELTPCNGHLRDFAEVVKKGVIEAGGFPLEFPVMSLGETIMKPSTMLFRNKCSPYQGRTLRGMVRETWLRGASVYRRGAAVTEREGRELLRAAATVEA